tara:strand:+ start:306 stop:1616 length:1311 start_codon:yes stop_codon:yes gene_type:complete
MADNLKETRNIVAELEDLLKKSTQHARDLPRFMSKLLGTLDQVVQLEEEIARLKEEQNEAGDEQSNSTKRGVEAQQQVTDIIDGQVGKIKDLGAGILAAARGARAFAAALMANPLLVAVGAIVLALGDFLRTANKVREEIGGSVTQSAKLAFEIQKAQRSSVLLQFSGQLVRDTAKAITQEFGTINAASSQAVKNIAEFAKLNSITASEAVKVARLFDILAISSDAARDNLKDAAMNAGVLVNQAFEDVARNADFFAKFTDEGAKNINRALVFAKQLGLSLDATSKISEKLLNVEEAIAAQFQLSAVLGRRVNFEEATRLNFLGKTGQAQESVVSEIRRAVAELGGLNNLLPAQRQAIADAFNLTTSEVGKIVSAGINVAVGAPAAAPSPVVPQLKIENDDIKALGQKLDDLTTTNAQGFDNMQTTFRKELRDVAR